LEKGSGQRELTTAKESLLGPGGQRWGDALRWRTRGDALRGRARGYMLRGAREGQVTAAEAAGFTINLSDACTSQNALWPAVL
jgi:hypothetical protein